jgi:uncharacterized protein (UPF0332 family)
MTDKETLLRYRLAQATDTLADAERMLQGGFTPRSVVNRAYYAMFYAVMALFLHAGVAQKTSKHSGVIALFDREFVHPGRIEQRFSKMLHRMFDARQESDYRELLTPLPEEASKSVSLAREFVEEIERQIGGTRRTA